MAIKEELITKAKASLCNAPSGELVISTSNEHVQYYRYIDGKREYISKKNISLIKQLAQKKYDEALLQNEEKLTTSVQIFNLHIIEQLLSEFPAETAKLITPYVLSNDEYAKQWKNASYETKERDGAFTTVNKDKVRSKSEVIIADRLFYSGIPYRYEAKVKLLVDGVYKNFYPDFTVLNKRKRQVFILEHFGIMDNQDYLQNAVSKINVYAENGYIQGKNILFTFETRECPLSMTAINKLIDTYLI